MRNTPFRLSGAEATIVSLSFSHEEKRNNESNPAGSSLEVDKKFSDILDSLIR